MGMKKVLEFFKILDLLNWHGVAFSCFKLNEFTTS
jgi:hypothetical protein